MGARDVPGRPTTGPRGGDMAGGTSRHVGRAGTGRGRKSDAAKTAARAKTPAQARSHRGIVARYGGHDVLVSPGWTPISAMLLRFGGRNKPGGLGLNSAELMFVLHLLSYKWDEKRPFPAYKTVATRMGITSSYARTIGRDLERKGYLLRVLRTANTNLFDLQPLFDALAEHARRNLESKQSPDEESDEERADESAA